MLNRYFYLHDRLGSVRQVISYMTNGLVLNSYTYDPFGEMIAAECAETIDNPFKFTGQYFDSEIGQYYLRARQYDPQLMRFTGRDPFGGKEQESLSLHKYLYCQNEPVNRIDPSGLYTGYDDAAFAAAGAITGLLTQFMADLCNGQWSSFGQYFVAGVGGAAGGWCSLYAGAWGGKMVGGAIEGVISNLVTGVMNGDVDWERAAVSGVIGGFGPSPCISGITAGRGSFAAVTYQMITKMRGGLINSFTSKTFGKIVAHNVVENAYIDMIEATYGD
jgi:RHS repeat-associated protein